LRLQISNNGWLPMSLPLYPALVQLQASSANVRSFTLSDPTLKLQQLVLDHSVLTPLLKDMTQTDMLLELLAHTTALQYISCNNCSLQVRSHTDSQAADGSASRSALCTHLSPHLLLRMLSVCCPARSLRHVGSRDRPDQRAAAQLAAQQRQETHVAVAGRGWKKMDKGVHGDAATQLLPVVQSSPSLRVSVHVRINWWESWRPTCSLRRAV